MATDGDISAALRRAYQALAPEAAERLPPAAGGAASAEGAQVEWEERAAIREFDGGMSRDDAERLTALELGARP